MIHNQKGPIEAFKTLRNNTPIPNEIAKSAAIRLGVSKDTIKNIRYILRYGTKELCDLVEEGVGLQTAAKFIRVTESKPVQKYIIRSHGKHGIYHLVNASTRKGGHVPGESDLRKFSELGEEATREIKHRIEVFEQAYGANPNICIPKTLIEYECAKCGLQFDTYTRIQEESIRCPQCHHGKRYLKIRSD